MTVAVDDRRREHPGNGVATVLTGPRAFKASHVAVYEIDDTTLDVVSLAGGFTLTGVGGRAQTTVTLAVPTPVGKTCLVLRTVPYEQDTDITNQGSFLPEVVEGMGDALAMQIQQIADGLSRTIRASDTSVGIEPIPLEPNRYIVTDVNGNPALSDSPPVADLTLRANLAASAGAGLVGFLQSGTGAVARTAQDKMRDAVHAKDFGVVADGATDDTTALQAAVDYIAANGGVLELPSGEINITAPITRASAAEAFTIRGAGWTATKIIRASDFAGSMINIGECDNWTAEDFTLVANHSLYPNGNHGIVWYNGSHVKVQRIKVYDWKNSAIIGYTSPASTDYVNNVIEDCYVNGNDAANNGILLADLVDSHIINCDAVQIGKTGSPCYALQIKNGCQRCSIRGGRADGAIIGVAAGNYDVSGTHLQNMATSVFISDCNLGVGFGTTIGFTASDITIDMGGAGNAAVDFQGGSVGCVVNNLTVRNMLSSKSAVRCRSGDTDNVVHIACISNVSGIASPAAEFNAGSLRNTVTLERYANPTTTTDSSTLVADTSSGSTNVFEYRPLPNRQASTIASDAITLRHSRITTVVLDTEGAAATDNLATINGPGFDGQIITLSQAANARDVTFKHATGNIRLNGAVDYAMTTAYQTLTLRYASGLSAWIEAGRGTAS